MNILVDSSVWIDYFSKGLKTAELDFLIEENQIIINDLILAELIPSLKIKGHNTVAQLLNSVQKVELNINWQEIIDLQVKCLRQGINKVGIPDLIIAQSAIQNKLRVYTLDKHFELISRVISLKLFKT